MGEQYPQPLLALFGGLLAILGGIVFIKNADKCVKITETSLISGKFSPYGFKICRFIYRVSGVFLILAGILIVLGTGYF